MNENLDAYAIAHNEQILNDQIDNALVSVAKDWARLQENELNNLATSLNPLSTTPSFFLAAAWLNTGISATTTLFPTSAVAGAVSKLSVPLALAGYAADAFQAAFNSERDRVEAMLRGDYMVLKNRLATAIRAVPDTLRMRAFGREVGKLLFAVLRRRAAERGFDRHVAYGHCTAVLKHAVIETDVGEIQRRTREGFGALCEKIQQVYLGTHASTIFGFHDRSMTMVDPSRFECYLNPWIGGGREPLPQYDPQQRQVAACGAEQHMIWSSGLGPDGSLARDSEQLRHVLTNIWNYDVQQVDAWGETRVYAWPSEEPTTVRDLAETYQKGEGVGNLRNAIVVADQAEWPRTMSMNGA